jgi:hypothetical protein
MGHGHHHHHKKHDSSDKAKLNNQKSDEDGSLHESKDTIRKVHLMNSALDAKLKLPDMFPSHQS